MNGTKIDVTIKPTIFIRWNSSILYLANFAMTCYLFAFYSSCMCKKVYIEHLIISEFLMLKAI